MKEPRGMSVNANGIDRQESPGIPGQGNFLHLIIMLSNWWREWDGMYPGLESLMMVPIVLRKNVIKGY